MILRVDMARYHPLYAREAFKNISVARQNRNALYPMVQVRHDPNAEQEYRFDNGVYEIYSSMPGDRFQITCQVGHARFTHHVTTDRVDD